MEQSAGNKTGLFFLGAAVGGLIVALTTPRRGQEIRANFKDALHRGRSKAEETADDFTSELAEAVETTRNKFGSTKLVEEK